MTGWDFFPPWLRLCDRVSICFFVCEHLSALGLSLGTEAAKDKNNRRRGAGMVCPLGLVLARGRSSTQRIGRAANADSHLEG